MHQYYLIINRNLITNFFMMHEMHPGWCEASSTSIPLTHLKRFDQRDNYLNIDAPGGVQYHFIPGTMLVMRELPEVKLFNSEPESATQFVEQLPLTDEQLADVVRDLPLFFGLKSTKRTTRTAGLVHAMSGGKVAVVAVVVAVVVVERPNMTPPRKRGPEDLPVEYYTFKPYTLGPHEEPGYEPNPHATPISNGGSAARVQTMDEASIVDSAQTLAQADTLKKAAKEGTPYCEICAK